MIRTRTRAVYAALLALLFLIAGAQIAQAANGGSIAYVAQVQGKATAQLGGSPPRALERFSPLFAGDMLTIADGGKVTARFVSTGQTQNYASADLPAQRHISTPPAPTNDVKSRLMRAVFDDQRAGLARASHNAQAAIRGLEPPAPLLAILPRKTTLLHSLTFTWQAATPEPVQITLYNSDNHQIWKAENVKANQLAYPADAPALKPEESYHWTISRSETETSTAAVFKIASVGMEKETIRRLEMLKQIDFADAEEAGLTTAAMLYKLKLYTNALQTLAPLTDKSVSPLVHVLRFHAYLGIELKDLANDEKDAQGESAEALKAQWEKAESSPE